MSIWDYSQIKNLISSESQLTLKEGNTPLKTVSFEDQKILIKEEFKNPTGSFKDRSLAFVISRLKSKNINHAVISSSGNAVDDDKKVGEVLECSYCGMEYEIMNIENGEASLQLIEEEK